MGPRNANYGVSDVLSNFAAQCEHDTRLHFLGGDILFPELIDPDTLEPVPIESGREGELSGDYRIVLDSRPPHDVLPVQVELAKGQRAGEELQRRIEGAIKSKLDDTTPLSPPFRLIYGLEYTARAIRDLRPAHSYAPECG